jgi:hypothetical protein
MFVSSSVLSAYPLYKRLTPEFMAQNTQKVSKSASVQNEVAYFKARVARVETVDDFLKDSRLLRFALKAYNLEDQMEFPARIKQIMKDDATDSRSLVQRMTSPGYREINAAFDFFRKGVTKLKSDAFQQEIVARYYSARNVDTLTEMSPDLADALHFERMIGKAKTGYDILGDRILFGVVLKALNLPPQAGTTKIERLKELIESKLDFSRLNDSKYVRSLVERYLIMKDVESRKNQGGGLLDMFA